MADNVADNIKKLGTHLAQLRINNNLTRNDLARIVGKSCAPSIIERCETGTGRPIPILMLIRIANALGWHIDFVEKTAIVS
jgi:DNA-binding XRE family transcriptional regulator